MKNSSSSIIVFVIIFLAITAIYVFFVVRRREITFEGTVTDKDINESVAQNSGPANQGGISFGNRGNVTHQYMIKVKTDAGKTVNYQVSEGQYEIIKIGDRVSKGKGTTEVNIVSSTQNSPPQAPSSPPTNTTPPNIVA